jgi:hypothetical protein
LRTCPQQRSADESVIRRRAVTDNARWIGRLLVETPAGLRDARYALALVEQLPRCRDALHGLARQR